MKNFLVGLFLVIIVLPLYSASNDCTSQVQGYKVVKDSTYDFNIGKDKACFFAFYTDNPEPYIDPKGYGNNGEAIWYAYYKIKTPDKIKEFPIPPGHWWNMVCTIDAVSFVSMYGDKHRDVTVIGSCNKNKKHYTYPVVFMRRGDKFIFDADISLDLYQIIDLTVSDLQRYIKSPQIISELKKRGE